MQYRLSVFGILLLGACALHGAEPAANYGIKPDLKTYPQAEPKEALGSLIKAVEAKQVGYLLAHLSDPTWVKGRVKSYGGKFEEVVIETRDQMSPLAIKWLKRFLKDGKWETKNNQAVATHAKITDRVVRLEKIDGRWVLKNDYTP